MGLRAAKLCTSRLSVQLRQTTVTRETKIKALIGYLVLSAASVRGIPFLKPWGADLFNILAYQNCSGTRNPYLMSGGMCGDPFGRPMVYPPLLLHSFAWIRGMPLEDAMYIWTAASVVMLAASLYAWTRLAEHRRPEKAAWDAVLFSGLLLIQYPLVFLIERGGTDVPPVLLWTISAVLFCSGELLLSGVFAGLASAFKLYPIFPSLILGIALLVSGAWTWRVWRLRGVRFGVGWVAAFAGVHAYYFEESNVYFTMTLPAFSRVLSSPFAYAHSIYAFAGAERTLYPRLILLLFFLLFCWSASSSIRARPGGTFAALLAMSTYFGGTTYDYNLVTVYPLLLWCFLEARRTGRFTTLWVGAVAMLGDRELWASGLWTVFTPQSHLALQMAWLMMVAIDLARSNEPEHPIGLREAA